MKRFVAMVFALLMVVSPLGVISMSGASEPGTVTPAGGGTFGGGDGSAGNPYIITDALDLQAMNGNLGAYYVLGNDIDASATTGWDSGQGFLPIGSGAGSPFIGNLNGNNRTISGLFMNRAYSYKGLFGFIDTPGQVSNVCLDGVDINTIDADCVGSLVGYNAGTIINCHSTGDVTSNVAAAALTGGLVGYNLGGAISDSSFTGNVSTANPAGSDVGGLVGLNMIGTISDCQTDAHVIGYQATGGLAGRNQGTVLYSGSTGDVLGTSRVGGIIGDNNGAASDSWAGGDVSASDRAGGFIGYNGNSGNIDRCFASGDVSATGSYVGGFIGANLGSVDNCYATGEAIGDDCVGGLVGDPWHSMSNCYSTGYVASNQATWFDVEGFVGRSNGYTFTNCFWDIETSGQATGGGGGAVGLTTAQAMTKSSYVGWDFIGTWYILEGTDYPKFQWDMGDVVFSGGSGTQADPFQVSDVLELQNMNLNIHANYTLLNDIDASATLSWNGGEGFQPIGDSTTRFTGTFDGNGFAISDIHINRPGQNYVGLFGGTGPGSVIGNLSLVDSSIVGNKYVGGLVGSSDCDLIEGCSFEGDVVGYGSGYSGIGGLVGEDWDYGVFERCFTSGTVTGYNGGYGIGGLLGLAGASTVSECYSTADVQGSSNDVGGMLGNTGNGGTITNSYCTGSVTGGGDWVGGLIGWNNDYDVTNCYSTGPVSSPNSGGLVGFNNGGTIANSFWDTATSGKAGAVGGGSVSGAVGLPTASMMTQTTFTDAGWNFTTVWWMASSQTRPFLRWEYGTEIRNSHQLQMMPIDMWADYELAEDIDLSDITEPSQMWGTSVASGKGFYPIGDYLVANFFGTFEGNSQTISNLFINRGAEYYVGLFSQINQAYVANLTLTNVSVKGYGYVGGFAGDIFLSDIANVHVSGSITGTENLGGIAGRNSGDVSGCSASGSVTGTGNYIGAFVGQNEAPGVIHDCQCAVTATGIDFVGGFVGNNDIYAEIMSCTATGNASGTMASDNVGGFAGYNNAGNITGCSATGVAEGNSRIGGFVGVNEAGIISGCHAGGEASGTANYIGGFVGYNANGVLENCTATGDVTGASIVGGLAGINAGGTISNSRSSGESASPGNYVGGLVGDNNANIINCTSTSNVSGSNYLGGLVGRTTGPLSGCSAHSNVSGVDYVGGIAGHSSGSVTGCHFTGRIEGDDWLGGGVGFAQAAVTSCWADAFVNASTGAGSRVGGLIGENQGLVDDCWSSGTVIGDDITGGLIGSVNGQLTNSHSSSTVYGRINTGGLGGKSYFPILYSFASGDVYATGDDTGGLVGEIDDDVSFCYATGHVSGAGFVGGLIGRGSMSVQNCYARGDVTGTLSSIGGFMGGHDPGLTITNCYSSGHVTGNAPSGGFIGNNTGTVTDCHWDTQTSGWLTSAGGIGNTTAEMKRQATFVNWDFSSVWGIYETNTYPFLQAFGPESIPAADTEINLTATANIVQAGDVLTYILFIYNHGPDNAADLIINVTLPSGVTYINSTEPMPFIGRFMEVNAGTYIPGEGGTIFINVSVDINTSGTLVATAFVISPTPDPGAYSNTSAETTEVNRAPDGTNAFAQTDEDSPTSGLSVWLQSYYSDPDSDPVTVVSHETSDFGAAVTISANGSFTYDPTVSATLQALHGGEFVNDTMNYTVSDGRGGFDTAVFTVMVEGVEGYPIAVNDTASVEEDGVAQTLLLMVNDIVDEEGDTFRINNAWGAIHGTLEVLADGSAVIYTPTTANYSGYDTFMYSLRDSSNATSDPASVNITITAVNDPPLDWDNEFTVEEDSGPNTLWLLENSFDREGDDLTISAITQPPNGTVAITEAGKNLTYEPDANFFGTDYFNYTLSDGTDTNVFMVTVTVTNLNDDPVITPTTLPDAKVGTPYRFNLSATDIDSDSLSFYSSSLPAWLILSANGTLSGTPLAAGVLHLNITVSDGDGGYDTVAFTLTVNSTVIPATDTDGDGVPDSEDAFPTDPAASVDADDDGLPDAWNPGYNETDSTTGLVLDDDPLNPPDLGPDDQRYDYTWMFIILILVVAAIIAAALLLKGKGRAPAAAPEEAEAVPEEVAPEETSPEPAPAEEPAPESPE